MGDEITSAIEGLTRRLHAYRAFVILKRGEPDMSRLSEKLAKAAGVAQRQTVKIEARADSLIAREADIEAKTDKAFSPHEAILTDAEKGLEAVERQLALLSNAPLESSGSSPEVEQSATFRAEPGETIPAR